MKATNVASGMVVQRAFPMAGFWAIETAPPGQKATALIQTLKFA
jgi:hypothetical protein